MFRMRSKQGSLGLRLFDCWSSLSLPNQVRRRPSCFPGTGSIRSIPLSHPKRPRMLLVLLLAVLQGCTHFAVEDCGGEVLGNNEPRIRSSHFRMLIADLPAAANRFVPYAAMSALAYAEDANCGATEPRIAAAERDRLETELAARGWREVKDVQWVPPCENDVGLFFRVWASESDTRQVVVAFRGTWGMKDWLYGNLHWVTRFLPMEDQYSQARKAAQHVFDRFPADPLKATHFYATGHSLGGGLAQHVLYSHPTRIDQAIAFDPSSATGFADQSSTNKVLGCQCNLEDLTGEPRIFRVYDAYEILSNLRIFHKIFLPPERHIQEVRFPNEASHSMKGLANYLISKAKSTAVYAVPWYAGKGSYTSSESCTAAFVKSQKDSCDVKVTQGQWLKCPQ